MTRKTKITVVGSGYVGMSLAILFAQYNDVVVLDVNPDRVDTINNKQSTVSDEDMEAYLADKELSLSATLDKKLAYDGASFVVVATPTNYDPDTNRFDTSLVDDVVSDAIELNTDAIVVIKSTISPGTTDRLNKKYKKISVIFNPEFLTEANFIEDFKNQTRIILGGTRKGTNKLRQIYS